MAFSASGMGIGFKGRYGTFEALSALNTGSTARLVDR
jgi:hypothetical protein